MTKALIESYDQTDARYSLFWLGPHSSVQGAGWGHGEMSRTGQPTDGGALSHHQAQPKETRRPHEKGRAARAWPTRRCQHQRGAQKSWPTARTQNDTAPDQADRMGYDRRRRGVMGGNGVGNAAAADKWLKLSATADIKSLFI